MKTTTKLWIGLGILALASPIGLWLPDTFKAGAAWGEWGSDEVKQAVGYIPAGLERLGSFWNAVMPDYAFKGWEGKGMGHLSVAYIFSAIIGVALCVGSCFLAGKLLAGRETRPAEAERKDP